jgi:acetylornithine deacetylase/succinyl-diaminopimelate desuccinylase-like protein
MIASREAAINAAKAIYDDGTFILELEKLVAVPTESSPPHHKADLVRYCGEILGPMLETMGFSVALLENPEQQHGPVMLATRIEDAALPTVLIYGHGDVVRAMPERWREGLDPWTVKVEGDKIYGRGVVDNKGQHLLAIEALRAVLSVRGRLGFNAKIFVETGEEAGSPGLRGILLRHSEACAADVFVALDGLRQSVSIPEVTLGTRGGVAMDLVVDLREGGFHSGHWGGLLIDPAVVLSHAIASIISRDGRILVAGWTPASIPEDVRRACANIVADEVRRGPFPDPGWGEPGLSRAERIFMWTSAVVLASVSGQPEAPVNAVSGKASARIQVRHTVDVPADGLLDALRKHLDEQGFQNVQVLSVQERDAFPASRTSFDDPWVKRIVDSITRTSGRSPNMVPNIGASGPSELFRQELGTPVLWLPFSYGGCNQHGPDEHGLGSLFREGLGLMAGIWWDFGEIDDKRRPPRSETDRTADRPDPSKSRP